MAYVTWMGETHLVPAREPPQDRSLASLDPRARLLWLAWVAEAQQVAAHVDFIPTETRRSLSRQVWLYSLGRSEPHRGVPEVTWTLHSNHRAGLAVDYVMMRRDTGELIWTPSSYAWLYRVVPPQDFGLELITTPDGRVVEWVHLQVRGSDALREAGAVEWT